jgi:hypothetical protein
MQDLTTRLVAETNSQTGSDLQRVERCPAFSDCESSREEDRWLQLIDVIKCVYYATLSSICVT